MKKTCRKYAPSCGTHIIVVIKATTKTFLRRNIHCDTGKYENKICIAKNYDEYASVYFDAYFECMICTPTLLMLALACSGLGLLGAQAGQPGACAGDSVTVSVSLTRTLPGTQKLESTLNCDAGCSRCTAAPRRARPAASQAAILSHWDTGTTES